MSTSQSASVAKVSISQLGGLRRLIFSPGLVLYTLRHGRLAGRDEQGNLYFERPAHGIARKGRRWVVYAGPADPSAVAPRWHAWLHRLTDQPLPETGGKPWVKPHQPNLTGTAESYRPAGHDYKGGQRAAASADYESWTPGQG
ncbi:NADH-ubiquinone oxidoreductase subunit NDUFA12 family protein [Acidocella sp.]|uniref:NADH-ubiquinone oxidoreductase subunit NDUFA12 family protein n=1 Tax=Acidocella sp. TaxID=50710 RepID=UPI00182D268F|nr:NADH-ubiquinone oxidoreductase subunit NDUFA12 family protein [Acidocella sp.]NNM55593.1 NADH:ubiquinone oxidoreductase [Acidocella sp.]